MDIVKSFRQPSIGHVPRGFDGESMSIIFLFPFFGRLEYQPVIRRGSRSYLEVFAPADNSAPMVYNFRDHIGIRLCHNHCWYTTNARCTLLTPLFSYHSEESGVRPMPSKTISLYLCLTEDRITPDKINRTNEVKCPISESDI